MMAVVLSQVVINNLDALIMEPVGRATFASMSDEAPHLLAEIEALYKTRFQAHDDAGLQLVTPMMPTAQRRALSGFDIVKGR